jgi:NADH dehydrogenase subunit M (EC 1.6.5.3)
MQFVEKASWIGQFNVFYHLGIDGISMPLIILTTFSTVLVIIAGWEVIKNRVADYMAAFLMMEGLIIGVFSSMDSIAVLCFLGGITHTNASYHRRLGWTKSCLCFN